jgi:hypothetical protein
MRPFHTPLWRILGDLFLFISVFWAPPVVAFLIGAALLFFFPRFYEFLIAAFFLDALYGVPAPFWGAPPLIFSVAAAVLFVLFGVVKRRIRF